MRYNKFAGIEYTITLTYVQGKETMVSTYPGTTVMPITAVLGLDFTLPMTNGQVAGAVAVKVSHSAGGSSNENLAFICNGGEG